MSTNTTATAAANDDYTNGTMGEADTLYQELATFLSSPRSDLRKAAAEAALAALSSATDNDEAARRLAALDAIPRLCRIASAASSEEGSNDALASLSILCSHESVGDQCVLDFVEGGSRGVGRMLEIALSSPPPPSSAPSQAVRGGDAEGGAPQSDLEDWRKRVNYACALLANATRTEKGAVEFIGLSFPEEAVPSSSATMKEDEEKPDTVKPTATLLLSRFLNPSFVDMTSAGYESSVDAWNAARKLADAAGGDLSTNVDEYDSDMDDEALEKEDPASQSEALEPPKAEPVTNEHEHYDPYQYVAAVIMNVTQLETGRNFLMKLIHSLRAKRNGTLDDIRKDGGETKKNDTTSTSHLQSLLPQLASYNLHRRRGMAGTLKNCCFSKDSIWWLMNVVHMDKALLTLLAGPEELTIDEKVGLDPDYWLSGSQKVREPDALVRLYVAEALLLLMASGRRARETLRERRTYVIIKLADMVEENEEVSERLLECVQYLRRDEEGTDEGSSDRRAYESYARGMLDMDDKKNNSLKALPPSTTAEDPAAGTGAVGGDDAEDYDNID